MIRTKQAEFTDLSRPDPAIEYWVGTSHASGYNYLMKLILVVNKFPDVMVMIKDQIDNYPAQINEQNSEGLTPLMLACTNVPDDISNQTIGLLLKSGANVDTKDKSGETALFVAIRNHSPLERVKLLLEYGADPNLQVFNGQSALMMAALNYYNDPSLKCVKLLLKSGANVNLQNDDGDTALMIISFNHGENLSPRSKCVNLLLKAGTDVNLQNKYGITTLMCYCRFAEFTKDIISILLLIIRKTPDICVKSNSGYSAYDYLVINCHYPSLNDEYIESLIKGEIKLSNTKSARKN